MYDKRAKYVYVNTFKRMKTCRKKNVYELRPVIISFENETSIEV